MFTASSTGGVGPFTFSWTFGDGNSSLGSSATHTYTTSGNFTVSLIAIDANGAVATFTQPIVVAALLQVSFIYNPSSLVATQSATFTASTTGGVGTPSVDWSFGDGNSSTANPASHTYTAFGSFEVTVTATDSNGVKAASSQTVTVNAVLTASFTYSPSSVEIGQPVLFNGSASGGVSPYSYSWSFGDGSTDAGPSVSHVYSSSGSFNVSLTVTDSISPQQTLSSIQSIVVSSQLSLLNATFAFSPSLPQTGQQVTFTALTSGGLSPYRFTWSFGDGSTGSGNPVSHVYDNATTYSVVLVVTDTNGTIFSVTQSIAVLVPPNPSIVLTVLGNQTVTEGSNLTFNATAVEDSSMQISIACDSCSALGANFTSSSGSGVAFGIFSWTPSEAQGPGVYSVVISSTDGIQVVNATVTITVTEVEAPPVLNVPGNLIVRDGETLVFTVNATDSDSSADSITVTASGLPDGSSFDPATGIFYWPIQGVQPGPYTLTFTATDDGIPSLQDNATVVVHVDNGNGRCFICNMFLESQLTLNSSPLMFILKAMATLIGSLTVLTVKYGVGWWRRKTNHKLQRIRCAD